MHPMRHPMRHDTMQPSERTPTSRSRLELGFDRLHAAARARPALHRLAIVSRILLALGFLPTGLVKALGHRFTQMPVETTVGFFFEAMYRTGAYWNLIGVAQMTAAILLLVPRTATLGAVLFFPIILNIHAITTSVGFVGTPVVTGLMLLACTFLLCWDYDRWKTILFPVPTSTAAPVATVALDPLERAGYVLGTAAGLGLFSATRSLLPGTSLRGFLAVGAVAALLVLAGWLRLALRGRRPSSVTLPSVA